MARKLKVFRTAAGFHDAYVAAPSRKAALTAWGSDADLFARGMAEEVTDAAEMAEALAQPGVVVRRSRGSAAEQLAALPEDAPKVGKKADKPQPVKRGPKPTRAALDDAEAELAEAERRAKAVEREFAERQAALDRERRAAKREAEAAVSRAERVRRDAAEAYDAAVKSWRE